LFYFVEFGMLSRNGSKTTVPENIVYSGQTQTLHISAKLHAAPVARGTVVIAAFRI
jgi:type 1 fimbria pilin